MKKIFILFLSLIFYSCLPQTSSRYFLLTDLTQENITLFKPGTGKGSWGEKINDPYKTLTFLQFFTKIEVKLYQSHKEVTLHTVNGSLTRTLTYDPQKDRYYNYEDLPIIVIITKEKSGERVNVYVTFLENVICFYR